MTTDTDLRAAVVEIQRVTPPNDTWTGYDFNGVPAPIDDTIATILNAVASGDLVPRDEVDGLVAVAGMVDQWGNGIRHETAHEARMVKASRAALTAWENRK